MFDAGGHGGGLAVVAAEIHHSQARIAAGDCGSDGEALVFTAVVDEYHLVFDVQGVDGADNRVV
jgi:hypothetical protein